MEKSSPVTFHIVSCLEEQPKAFTLFLCSGHSYCTETPPPGHGSLPGDGLQPPREPLLHQESICALQFDVGWGFFLYFFTAQDLFQPVAAALSEWWSLAKSEQCQILCFTITSAEVNEHCQESTMNTLFRY